MPIRDILADPVISTLVAVVVWPLVGSLVTYLCRGLARSESPTVRRLFAGFSAVTFDVPKLTRAVSQRPPMPSITDEQPPTPRGPAGIARTGVLVAASLAGCAVLVLLSLPLHLAGCAWWTKNGDRVVHVVHVADDACDAADRAELVLPREAQIVCLGADVADSLADRYEAARDTGAEQTIEIETSAGVVVVPPPDVAAVVEQTPARKRKRTRKPRHVDGGAP